MSRSAGLNYRITGSDQIEHLATNSSGERFATNKSPSRMSWPGVKQTESGKLGHIISRPVGVTMWHALAGAHFYMLLRRLNGTTRHKPEVFDLR